MMQLRLRIGALALVLVVAGSASTLVFTDGDGLPAAARDLDGPRIFLLVCVIAALSLILAPAALLAAGAGYLAGALGGTALALTGLTVGALACAAVARRVATERGPEALGQRVVRLADSLRARPLHSVTVARLIPGVPFHLTSYAAGLARIDALAIFAGTAIGFGPRCFLYAALGGSLGSPSQLETQIAIALTLALVVVLMAITRHRRRRIMREGNFG